MALLTRGIFYEPIHKPGAEHLVGERLLAPAHFGGRVRVFWIEGGIVEVGRGQELSAGRESEGLRQLIGALPGLVEKGDGEDGFSLLDSVGGGVALDDFQTIGFSANMKVWADRVELDVVLKEIRVLDAKVRVVGWNAQFADGDAEDHRTNSLLRGRFGPAEANHRLIGGG